jgi:hypothetical protein
MAFPLDSIIDLWRDVHSAGSGTGYIRTFISGGSVTVDPTVLLGSTPTLSNTSAPVANTEHSYTVPADTKRFILKARGSSAIKIAYVSGQSGTTYLSVPPGASYEEFGLKTGVTVYFQCSKASETVEILSWA